MPKGPKPESYNIAPSYADQRTVEMLFDEMHFNRLLQLAEAVCLRHTPDYPEHLPEAQGEGKVIEKLGTRGLRLALELQGTFENFDAEDFDDLTPDEPRIYPINRPEFFNGPMNRELLAKAEAFGAQLIDEAYDILGSDADTYVALFRDATTEDEQFQAIDWLLKRLVKLTGKRGLNPTDAEDEDETLYHPIRFSPKAVGQYPNHNLALTCLGVAITAASFFKKAGADIMHAGVMVSHSQSEILDCIGIVTDAIEDDATKQFGTPLSDLASERLKQKAVEAFGIYEEDRGTHSCVYVRLLNDRWFQVDPNYACNTVMAHTNVNGEKVFDQDAQVTDAYETLNELRDIAPGLELAKWLGMRSRHEIMGEVINAIKVPDAYRADIEQLLAAMTDESTIEPFHAYVIDLIQKTVANDEFLAAWARETKMYDYLTTARDKDNPDLLLDSDFYWAFEKFVQWGMPIDEWRVRCEQDEAFRQDRVEDIMRLPSILGIKYALSTQGGPEAIGPHSAVEFGLPDVRIGLSALNNIALYFDNDLSAHHWLSQWSSHLAVTDRLDFATRSRAHRRTLANNAVDLERRNLKYAPTNGKISEHAKLLGFSDE